PTNNATFGLTEMTYQQLAMSQVRAIEHNRAIVVAATSGVSAMIRPGGTITTRTEQFRPAILVEQVTLGDTETLATRLGSLPGSLLSALGILALVVAWVAARRQRGRAGDAAD
ncbi:MAG: ppm2, partial [Pseudonocardia sp.]|nr:ppm2 [Pseudonocardia sp.]